MSSFIKLIIGAGVLCLIGATPSIASRNDKKEDKGKPAETGEVLVYSAEYSRSALRGLNVGEIRFTILKPDEKEASASEIRYKSEAVSQGIFLKLFGQSFHQVVQTRVDASSLSLLANEKLDEQGKRERNSSTVVDREKGKLTFTEKDPNSPDHEPRVIVTNVSGVVFDLTAAIYYLRTQKLKTGDHFELTVSDSGRVCKIPIDVFERKRMKSSLGKTETIRIEAGIFGPDRLVDREGSMSIWMSDDDRRIPVKAHITANRGNVDIKLKSASPMTSK